ncbi:HAD family hydrolase [Xanthomonas bonasiae]|jgi:putative hydrolase of the HAD superfamily|uniref:HAD family hydrolase n=1 Tax=Xanthomonas bonasiae TaxID=2810351 RepID=UPI0017834299|nr:MULTISPECIES: HAD family hydrolase [Xanthomonas]MBD7922090.1 HAD family hydrolase [Xanthomonas surreyensis]MBN6113102.1 HAD family hydrolase [Xanthomonas bonasiae]
MPTPTALRSSAIALVGFDGDDTLWKSEDYYRDAEAAFEAILGHYLDLRDVATQQHLLTVERRNLKVFGYGAKGMTLSMIEAAIELTEARISARDLQRIVEIGRATLQHPVEVIAGVREAVAAIAADFEVVLITKGDLFHQEAKIAQSGLGALFPRIEIVSEKDPKTYAKVLAEFGVGAERFAMIGNSLRSDVEPVIALGGWGIHTPYATTWAHEAEHGVAADEPRLREVATAAEWPQAVADLNRHAAAQGGLPPA